MRSTLRPWGRVIAPRKRAGLQEVGGRACWHAAAHLLLSPPLMPRPPISAPPTRLPATCCRPRSSIACQTRACKNNGEGRQRRSTHRGCRAQGPATPSLVSRQQAPVRHCCHWPALGGVPDGWAGAAGPGRPGSLPPSAWAAAYRPEERKPPVAGFTGQVEVARSEGWDPNRSAAWEASSSSPGPASSAAAPCGGCLPPAARRPAAQRPPAAPPLPDTPWSRSREPGGSSCRTLQRKAMLRASPVQQ